MAIEKRIGTDGKPAYRVRVSRTDPVTGKRQNITIGTWRMKKDAQREEREAIDDMERGEFVTPTKMKVADVVENWLTMKRQGIAANSLYEYRTAYELHIKPVLGNVLVQKLTHDAVQQQVTAWGGAGMGASLVRRCVSVLKQSLALALKTSVVNRNVADGIEQPAKQQKKDLTPWTWSQLATFLDFAEHDHLFPLWHLLALEGTRRSEALGLR